MIKILTLLCACPQFNKASVVFQAIGCDKKPAHLSCLICSGDTTTDDALAEMERDPYGDQNLDEDKALVIRKLGLIEQEFDPLMNLPIKSDLDYPSNAFLFDGLSGLRAAFKKTATCL